MEQNPTYEKIEAYLNQSLSSAERQEFEQQIAQDTELATQVELQRFERDGMELLLEEDLRVDMGTWKQEMLQEYAEKNKPSGRVVRIRRIRYLAAAASVLIILSAAFWLIDPLNTNTPDLAVNTPTNETTRPRVEPNPESNLNQEEEQPLAQLTDPQTKGEPIPQDEIKEDSPQETVPSQIEGIQNLVPQVQNAPQVATQNNNLELASQNFDKSYLLDQNTEDKPQLQELVDAFSNGEYENALSLAGSFKDPYPLGQEFLAGSYFQLGQFQKAQQTYNNLMRLSVSDNGLRERTEWNLLLTYLALDQTNFVDFDRLLNRITGNNQHQFFDEADALKQQLFGQ